MNPELIRCWLGTVLAALSIPLGLQLADAELISAIVVHVLGGLAALMTIGYTAHLWLRSLKRTKEKNDEYDNDSQGG